MYYRDRGYFYRHRQRGRGSFVSGGGGSGPGPAASGTFINVDFGSATGQTVSQYVWGVATNDLADPDIWTNTTLSAVFGPLAYPLWRFNSQSTFAELAFPSGATTATTTQLNAVFGKLIDNWTSWFPANVRIIIGVGFPPTNWSSAANFATMCSNLTTYLTTRVSAATGVPMPIYGLEIGNEDDGGSGTMPSWYASYFNAASTFIKTANSAYKVLGPTFTEAGLGTVSSFTSACSGHYDALSYHCYLWGGGEPDFVANVGAAGFMVSGYAGTPYVIANNVSGAISGTTPIFLGEWNGNDTAEVGQTGDELQVQFQGAVFGANVIWSCLGISNNFQMSGVWEAYQNSDYGLVGADDVADGDLGISPLGYMLSKAAATTYGPRYTATNGSSNPPLNCIAVAGGPGAGNLAVMLINYSTSTGYTGQVALSHWPINGTGNGTVNQWLVNSANLHGTVTSVAVTSGLTASLTVPAASVMILYV